MKKSTLIMILSLVLAVALGVGGTLAYLTDTEDDINVMTVGKVDIDLIEQQRDGNGGLEPFEDGKVLLPLVGSAQGVKDEMGMPTASNYVDKIISVSNKNASSDAWVRLLVGFPVEMEQEGTANGPLHWNLGNKFTGVDDQYDAAGWSEDWDLDETEEIFEHDGIKYKVYAFNYKHILAPGAETDTAAVTGFYLDSRVDWDDETNKYFMYIDGVKKMVSGMAADGSVYIPVVAQAVQASGFETYEEAFKTAELPINPWAADESLLDEIPVLVSNVEELVAAFEDLNANITLTEDIELTGEWKPIGDKEAKIYYTGTFDGNGHEISGLQISDGDYVSFFGAIDGATIKNVTVSGSVTGENAAGIVARMESGRIENCTSNVDVSGSTKAGGIVCMTNVNGCVISNCVNNGDVDGGDSGIGGIVGYANATTIVENCENHGDIALNSSAKYAGGIIGYATSNANSASNGSDVIGCANYGKVKGTNSTGGIIGIATGTFWSIDNCSNNTEDADITGGSFGAILGNQNGSIVISGCTNTATGLKTIGNK